MSKLIHDFDGYIPIRRQWNSDICTCRFWQAKGITGWKLKDFARCSFHVGELCDHVFGGAGADLHRRVKG